MQLSNKVYDPKNIKHILLLIHPVSVLYPDHAQYCLQHTAPRQPITSHFVHHDTKVTL